MGQREAGKGGGRKGEKWGENERNLGENLGALWEPGKRMRIIETEGEKGKGGQGS